MMKIVYFLLKMFVIYAILAGSIFYIGGGKDATILGSLGKGFGFTYNKLSEKMLEAEDGQDLKGAVNATIDFYDSSDVELGTKEEFKEEFKKTQK